MLGWGGVSRTPSRTPRHRNRTIDHPRPPHPGRRRGGRVAGRSPDLPRHRAGVPCDPCDARKRPRPRTGRKFRP